MLDWSEITLRLGTAALVGGAIGLNRDLHGKAIGVRTLGIVALATSSIVLLANNEDPWRFSDAASRTVQGILTGVGFLGAGVILHLGPGAKVRGLTSAACTWLTACVGVLCGAGQWRTVIVCVGLTFLLLLFGGKFERPYVRPCLAVEKNPDQLPSRRPQITCSSRRLPLRAGLYWEMHDVAIGWADGVLVRITLALMDFLGRPNVLVARARVG